MKSSARRWRKQRWNRACTRNVIISSVLVRFPSNLKRPKGLPLAHRIVPSLWGDNHCLAIAIRSSTQVFVDDSMKKWYLFNPRLYVFLHKIERSQLEIKVPTVLNIFTTPIFRLIVEDHHFVQHPIKSGATNTSSCQLPNVQVSEQKGWYIRYKSLVAQRDQGKNWRD